MYYEPQVLNHAQARPHDDHHLPSCIQHLLQGSVCGLCTTAGCTSCRARPMLTRAAIYLRFASVWLESKMAEVLTLLERIQQNQDDIIRRLVVSSMQLLAVCVCASLHARLSPRNVAKATRGNLEQKVSLVSFSETDTVRNTLRGGIWRQLRVLSDVCCLGFLLHRGRLLTSLSV